MSSTIYGHSSKSNRRTHTSATSFVIPKRRAFSLSNYLKTFFHNRFFYKNPNKRYSNYKKASFLNSRSNSPFTNSRLKSNLNGEISSDDSLEYLLQEDYDEPLLEEEFRLEEDYYNRMMSLDTWTPNRWSQLGALLWKSYLTQKRRPLWTLAELLVPLILTGVLLLVYFMVNEKRYGDTVFEPFFVHGDARDFYLETVDGQIMASPTFIPKELYYAPRTPITDVVVRKLVDKLNMKPDWAPQNPCSQYLVNAVEEMKKSDAWTALPAQITATAYDNGSVLQDALFDLLKSYSTFFYAGIIFDDAFAHGRDTEHVNYTLRFPYDQRNPSADFMEGSVVYTWSTNQVGVNDYYEIHRWPTSSVGGLPDYWREGFLSLQRALDVVLTETLEPGSLCLMALTDVQLTRFPFNAYISHPLIEQFPLIMPCVLVVSFVLSLLYIARSLTIEKENHLVEYITIVTGLSNWVQWMSHFIINFIKLTLVSVVMTVMLCTTLLSASQPVLIFAFFFSFSLNVIAFGFFIGAFFKGANHATLCAGILWFLIFVPCLYAQHFYSDLSRTEKMCFSFIAHGATVIGCQMIGNLAARGSGLRWDNVLHRLSSNELAPYEMLLFLFLDSIPVFFLALYVDAVRSGRYPWHFIFSCFRCCCGMSSKSDHIENNMPSSFDASVVEKANTEKQPSLVIENVIKKYRDQGGQETCALNRFSLFVHPGELTVILGHNGAGKTTLMKILTGYLKPTSGSVYINNKNVSFEMNSIRHMLGYCPQYNTLFDCLTVEEHLKFYLKLKNLDAQISSNGEKLDKITRLLTKLRLDKKRHELARNLSGGQKRRLSLAIALVGGSQVILLDEPTSGMDPGAKGDIIDVLKHVKQANVTLVLVTHYLDEAELLGDRVAIISEGRLRCYGTNMFLKNRFGSGYRLTVTFGSPTPGKRVRTEIAAQRVQEAVDEMCPGGCRLLKTKGDEATFLLNSTSDTTETCRSHQLALFTLENLAEPLFIRSISVSMPSMQDVFMNCCSTDTKKDKKPRTSISMNGIMEAEDDTHNLYISLTTSERYYGISLLVQQFLISLKKRAIYCWRQKRLVFFQFLVLALSVGMGTVLINLLRRHTPNMPPVELDVSSYGPSVVPLDITLPQDNNTDTTKPNVIAIRITDQLIGTFTNSVFVDSAVQQLPRDTNMSLWLLNQSHFDADSFTRSHLFAVSVDQEIYTLGNFSVQFYALDGYFNTRASHSIGAILNSLDNVILKHFCRECRIRTTNHPLPQTTILYYPFGDDFVTVLCLIVGLSFFSTIFAVTIIEERLNGAKHLQLLCGLHLRSYWLANYVWDALLYLLACGMIILIWWLGGSLLFKQTIGLAYILLILVGYGVALLPYTYAWTFLLKTPASAMVVLTTVHLLLGLTPTIAVTLLAHLAFDQTDLQNLEEHITNVCASIFPQFTLARALMAYYNNVIMREQCETMNVCDWLEKSNNPYFRVTYDPLEWQLPGVGRLLLTMFLQGEILFCIVFIMEWFSLRPSRWFYSKSPQSTSHTVTAEMRTADPNAVEYFTPAQSAGIRNNGRLVEVYDLCIRYNKFNKSNLIPAAVEDLTFSVSRGEIFGFNGENGSGKTSTYKVFTGQLAPYSGGVVINGVDVKGSWRLAAKNIGYCPQFDALLERMTGYELLMHFARLRGLRGSETSDVINGLLTVLELNSHSRRLVKFYSGGNKRKLTLAIALLGSPALLLLDEPTCGVDPKSRRIIWNILKYAKLRLNTGIVLTSHDMEECEALCDRMGILVKGRLACIDTPGALAEKYGCHYILRITVENSDDLDDVEEAIFALLPNAHLKAKPTSCQVHFTIPKSVDVSWWKLYRVVEGLVTQWPLSDFAISRASLQEAFVAVARGELTPILDTHRF